jgi:hypothetical protein
MVLLALTVLSCIALGAYLARQGIEMDRVRANLEGRTSLLPPHVLVLLNEARDPGGADRIQAKSELLGMLRVRSAFIRRLPAVLGRAALFLGATTGFIELASGLPEGQSPWLGVACLGTGLAAQSLLLGLGRQIQKRAEIVVSMAETRI